MPYAATSNDSVLAQPAVAARIVFDTPRLGIGIFTEVEITLMILPYPSAFIPGNSACTNC